MTTGTVLVSDSLLQIGVLGGTQTIKAGDLAIGLRFLNRMLASWANVRTMLYTVAEESFSFVASQASYTTAEFSAGRPTALNYMYVTLSNVSYPCQLIVNQSYDDIGYKPAPGIPTVCYYDAAYPVGTMTFFPVPYSAELTCVVNTQRPLTGTIAAATDVLLPEGYEKAIVDNLSMYLATAYPGAPISKNLRDEANEGRRVLKVTNYTPLVSDIAWNRRMGPPQNFIPSW